MSKRDTGNDKVYQTGQLIIKTLDVAVHLLRHFPDQKADKTIVKTGERIGNDLLDNIIDLASVCCGSGGWDDTYRYISEAGVQIPGAVCAKMEYFNDIFDSD